jgi:hypothetical protein
MMFVCWCQEGARHARDLDTLNRLRSRTRRRRRRRKEEEEEGGRRSWEKEEEGENIPLCPNNLHRPQLPIPWFVDVYNMSHTCHKARGLFLATHLVAPGLLGMFTKSKVLFTRSMTTQE